MLIWAFQNIVIRIFLEYLVYLANLSKIYYIKFKITYPLGTFYIILKYLVKYVPHCPLFHAAKQPGEG